jgi:hypothetical protein
MQTPIDPTKLLGRHSRLHTATGIIDGTILAVGCKGFTIETADRTVRHLGPEEVTTMSLDFN